MSIAESKLETQGKTMSVKPGQLYVSGKINQIDKFHNRNKETRYRNRVLMKDNSDDFGYPMPVDVVAEQPLGKPGELWEGVVIIRTFRGDYETRPDENGEVKKIKQVRLDCYFTE
ncbi:MAG TPA: hypothetical protein PKZ22_15465 [Accumulibacter sp.]|jgi:hypothetical protein|nr:hypothetical protein [Accumulibacter sp.]